MIDHKTIKVWINLYLDGELAGDELEQFKQHIKECAECAKILKQQRDFVDSIRILKEEINIDFSDFKTELVKQIEKFKPKKSKIFIQLSLVFAIAIFLIGAL